MSKAAQSPQPFKGKARPDATFTTFHDGFDSSAFITEPLNSAMPTKGPAQAVRSKNAFGLTPNVVMKPYEDKNGRSGIYNSAMRGSGFGSTATAD